MIISKSNLVYFRDISNDLLTVEHPLTQRYLKVLERQRIDLIARRTRPHVAKLDSDQADVLFHLEYPHLQLPCQDCGLSQSTVHCVQCIQSLCQSCHVLLHTKGSRSKHTSRFTVCGSDCSCCSTKKPSVYCSDCNEYFCFHCFERIHSRGKRNLHEAMQVTCPDGNMVARNDEKCSECDDVIACLKCDYCRDVFCLVCFWRCHLNGNRRTHTATQVSVRPLCNNCFEVRASVYCEQCQELFCSDCFSDLHIKGGRKLHLFMDAMNILLLLERLDPAFQTQMATERKHILWAITKIQALIRGFNQRSKYGKRRDCATRIQKLWRGGETRRKLLGALNQFNWRKKQIADTVLEKPNDTDDKVLGALESRMKIANKDQQNTISRLRQELGITLDDDDLIPREDELSEKQIPLSPANTVKFRMHQIQRESDKLRRLLSIDD